MKPICYDLFCGLDGWGEAFLSEGYEVIGYDIVDMAKEIGRPRLPGLNLVLRDVRGIHGSELKDAKCIVASPPCQAYSYRAMPWKRAKALPPPDNELFNACFRIQREAIEAAGHYIPLVVENVCGAQKWVGRARWHFGSFYLWGDVPGLMPAAIRSEKKTDLPPVPLGTMYRETGVSSKAHITGTKVPGIKLSEVGFNVAAAQRYREGQKTAGHVNKRDGFAHTRHLTNQRESDGVKFSQSGDAWFDGKPRDNMLGDKGPAAYGSRSNSRKAASAMIAKIPFPLAVHIARCFKPQSLQVVSA